LGNPLSKASTSVQGLLHRSLGPQVL
jgi:hypothetical protein